MNVFNCTNMTPMGLPVHVILFVCYSIEVFA